jgi:hypothetical protein
MCDAATVQALGRLFNCSRRKRSLTYLRDRDRGQQRPFSKRESVIYYEALQNDALFDRAKWLRNDVVAHTLIRDTPRPKCAVRTFMNSAMRLSGS